MADKLELSGSLSSNLRAALTSAKRLRGHPVHGDTLQFWRALLAFARSEGRNSASAEHEDVEQLLAELQIELADRKDF